MLIEYPNKKLPHETETVPATKPVADRRLRALAFIVCIVFSALVWMALAALI